MLVLSRRKTESIRIGGEIVITLLDVKGDRARLGITAPKSITVMRSELDWTPPEVISEQRLAEMREWCDRYGSSEYWAGSNSEGAAMIVELLRERGAA